MIILIAAVSQNNVIGKSNQLPWYLPEDLKHFKELTIGKNVLMGRKTFESILKRLSHPLLNRKSIVISQDPNYKVPEGVKLYNSLHDALEDYKEQDVYVIGGATIYTQTIEKANKLYLTEIHKKYDGDVFFPKIDKYVWKETGRENHPEYSFVTYDR